MPQEKPLPEQLRQPELGKRVKAAMGYGNLSREQTAKVMGVGVGIVDTWTARTGVRADRQKGADELEQLWKLAEAVDLPREWFTADLGRLGEIVPEDAAKYSATLAQRFAQVEQELQALRELARQQGAHPAAARETKRAPRRRTGEGN